MTRYHQYEPTQPGFWYYYGRFIKWMSVITTVMLGIPLTIMFILAPEEAWDRLKIIGLCFAIYGVVITPAYYCYRDKST